jgi:hypothetical protein
MSIHAVGNNVQFIESVVGLKKLEASIQSTSSIGEALTRRVLIEPKLVALPIEFIEKCIPDLRRARRTADEEDRDTVRVVFLEEEDPNAGLDGVASRPPVSLGSCLR